MDGRVCRESWERHLDCPNSLPSQHPLSILDEATDLPTMEQGAALLKEESVSASYACP